MNDQLIPVGPGGPDANYPKPACPPGLEHATLNEVEGMYREGLISTDDLNQYLRAWNAGPHFTRAEWRDGAVRNRLIPEKKRAH